MIDTITPQDEVAFVLETIKTQWPGETWPDNLARINRDGPEILETGDRALTLELEDWNTIGASLGDRNTEPWGTEYDLDVETTVSVRVEALHTDEWGEMESASRFEALVTVIKHAINTTRSYPDVTPDADDIGYVCYQDHKIENERDLSSENRDYFRKDFDIRFRGKEELPDI